MAYEDMTYEYLLQRMMDRSLGTYPQIDNREGSVVFDSMAASALEHAIAYTAISNALSESFMQTASREYLLLGCEQQGIDITSFYASAGTHKGMFDVEVPIGSRWNFELYNYTVTEYLGTEDNYYVYQMVVDTPGTAPNNVVGDLTAITDMPAGLSYARVTECLIQGENETDDETIRKIYFDTLSNTAIDGNVAQYRMWCNEYNGIGNYKIFPLWNGSNTVKVSILNSSNGIASDELIADFQEYLDPGITGMGDGKAPIGAFVTVTTATEVPFEFSADVVMSVGYTDTTHITQAIRDYFSELSYGTTDATLVSYMSIGARILACNGVSAISNLLINGSNSDVLLETEQIPTVGNATWTVM